LDLSRRQFLQTGSAVAAGLALPIRRAGRIPDSSPVRWRAALPADMPEPDIPAHLLSRAAFGARPGDVERVRQFGPDAWIEEQLDYASLDDSQVEAALRAALPTLGMKAAELLAVEPKDNVAPQQLHLGTLYRMVFSPRQLLEVMVEFWSDHLNVDLGQGYGSYLKTVDDRAVIRPHALGKFRDLLLASAQSPAMLSYLNNDVSTRLHPNENYARELMELHTLGVSDKGYPYTEADVKEVARCFTGWSWERRKNQPGYGDFRYVDGDHDQYAKSVLGRALGPSLKIQDGYQVIDILSGHEATPPFLATKLVRRFVTDDPAGQTPDLVQRVADAYRRSDGDIKEMASTILRSREFAQSFSRYGGRFSRPTDFIVRAMRTLDLQPAQFRLDAKGPMYANSVSVLTAMGHVPFRWPTPDGYPDVKAAWGGATGLLSRWNVAMAMALGQWAPGWQPVAATPAGATAGQAVDFWVERLLHRALTAEDRLSVVDYLTDGAPESTPVATVQARLPETIALLVDSPYFQWR
jgi:uncharacterized protein (DUF1800 family)